MSKLMGSSTFLFLVFVSLFAFSQEGTPPPAGGAAASPPPAPPPPPPPTLPPGVSPGNVPIEGDLPPPPQPLPADPAAPPVDGVVQALEQEVLNPDLRDPFKLPSYLIRKIEEKEAATAAATAPSADSTVDPNSLAPIRRWPLSQYQVIAIVWGVKSPRVIFSDVQKGLHQLKIGDQIGNKDGTIERIENGEVVVVEGDTPVRIPVRKKSN